MWFGVIYRFAGEEVLVAKPAPAPGARSLSMAMVRRGAELEAPEFAELAVNDSDEGVLALLTQLLGIPENTTDVPIESSRVSFDANVKYSFYYLFQKQGLVTSKEQLFYRQNEPQQPQAKRLSDFVAHMAAIRPLFLEYGDCLEVENLDICGELTADFERHFGEVYGERFSYFLKRIDGLHSST